MAQIAYTSLSNSDSISLIINGKTYPVSRFVGSFAINQIPEAQCMMALGRNTRTLAVSAINTDADSFMTMMPVQVYFLAGPNSVYTNQRDINGKAIGTWPKTKTLIFDGYYVGYGYQKADGNVNFVIHLQHWLADLAFSSCLSALSSPGNPGNLVFPALVQPLTGETGAGAAAGPPANLSDQIGAPAIEGLVATDLWGAMRLFMCAMSQYQGFNPLGGVNPLAEASQNTPGTIAQLKINNRAMRALARIEGPANQCSDPSAQPPLIQNAYKYSAPTPLSLNLTSMYFGVARAITGLMDADEALGTSAQTMWDVLVQYYCAQFSLDLCPQIDRAQVVPSLPGYRGVISANLDNNQWQTILSDDYDWIEEDAMLPRPLRGVVAHGIYAYDAGGNFGEPAQGGTPAIGGAFASSSVSDGDGAILYVSVPPWIGTMVGSAANANNSSGTTPDNATNTASTPGNGKAAVEPTPATFAGEVQPLINAYAQSVFIQNSLRGRSSTISGRLRFDIGPGSHVWILGSSEQIIGNISYSADALASSRYAQVNRVTVDIDADKHRAGTTFVLTHMRNRSENESDRTSIAAHPFFGTAVMLGSPLSPALVFDAGTLSTN